MKKIIMLIAVLLLAQVASAADYAEIPLATGAVKLLKPIEIKHADMFSDGGTISVILKDKNGKEFPFCLDGRMQELELWQRPKPYHMFVNATYPESRGAASVPVAGKEEKAILKILQDWINENISKEDQANIADVSKHKNIKWTDQSYKARRILQLIDILKKR